MAFGAYKKMEITASFQQNIPVCRLCEENPHEASNHPEVKKVFLIVFQTRWEEEIDKEQDGFNLVTGEECSGK